MRLFWSEGYSRTSLQDLETAMAINRFSIYATFQSKHGLFLAALQHYRDTVVAHLLRDLETPHPGLQELRSFFSQFIELGQTTMGRWGCLICNSATELVRHDADVAQEVTAYKARLIQAFRRALTNAQARGELTGQADPDSLALYLLGSLFGLMLLLKTGAAQAELTQYVQTVLAQLQPPG